MGTKERRERERTEQREKILAAALKIISKEGFSALSMRKLADRIEYSAGSIYLYFESREAIAQELCERGFAKFLDALVSADANPGSSSLLHAIGSAYVAFGLEHPEVYRLIFMGDSDYMAVAFADKRADCAASRAYAFLIDLARRLVAPGLAADPIEITLAADMIWSTLHGIVSLRIIRAGFRPSSPDALTAYAVKALERTFNTLPLKPTSPTEQKRTSKPPKSSSRRGSSESSGVLRTIS